MESFRDAMEEVPPSDKWLEKHGRFFYKCSSIGRKLGVESRKGT